MGATWRFQRCFNSVSQVIQAFEVSFKGSFKRVSRIFHRSFKEVSRKVLQCLIEFKGLARVFQCCYVFKVNCCISLIAATRAEGGLVKTLI